jgi:hypothetical protein
MKTRRLKKASGFWFNLPGFLFVEISGIFYPASSPSCSPLLSLQFSAFPPLAGFPCMEMGLIGLSHQERGRLARRRARGPRSQDAATNQSTPPPM